MCLEKGTSGRVPGTATRAEAPQTAVQKARQRELLVCLCSSREHGGGRAIETPIGGERATRAEAPDSAGQKARQRELPVCLTETVARRATNGNATGGISVQTTRAEAPDAAG